FFLYSYEFDGTTTTSATCNTQHYWTNLFIGAGFVITLDRNYYHGVSGRAPKLGEPGMSQDVQATNNYFYNMKGHAFDVYEGTNLLSEGNVFESVTTPFTNESSAGSIFETDSSSAGTCSAYLGRSCQTNTASGSGSLINKKDTGVLARFQSYGSRWTVVPISASSTKSTVLANAGIGKVN
ncbi:pectin lyase-like protein, partial [Bimuria novae-zelandiae CBS 107.79]